MNIQRLSRKEKEDLYIQKMTELQRRWQNPVDGDWDFVQEMTDDKLDESIKDTVGQLKFEKVTDGTGVIVSYVIKGFVLLGVIGLLFFGVRQLF